MAVNVLAHEIDEPRQGVETTGNVFFVNSTTGSDSDGYGESPDTPFKTIDYAIGKCTANNGDIIHVMAGYTETVTAAGGIDVDVAGVKIKGHGQGSDRPTITFGTTIAADIDFDAANTGMENFIFTTTEDATAVLDVNAADVTLEKCEFRGTTGKQCVTYITTASDRTKVKDCFFRDTDAGTTQAILLADGDAHEIVENRAAGDYAAGVIVVTGKCLDVLVQKNIFSNLNATGKIINTTTGAAGNEGDEFTGFISGNHMFITEDVAPESGCFGTHLAAMAENYGANLGGETGVLAGTVST